MQDGKPGVSYRDVVIDFHGDPMMNRLVQMINGPMRKNLETEQEKIAIEQWVEEGATREGYKEIDWIFKKRCIKCHDLFGEAEHAPLTSYEEVVKHTKGHEGKSWQHIAELSHQHFFGIGLIFFGIGLVLFQTKRWLKLKVILTCLGFLTILTDIGSWWLAKLYSPFAAVIMGSGAVQGVAILLIVLVSLYEMWFARTSGTGESS